MSTIKTSIGFAALFLAVASSTALAGGFSIREQSAEGLGEAFAGVAAGTNDLSGMFWNPATMSLHSGQGFVSESVASIIAPYSRAKDGVAARVVPAGLFADSGNVGELAFVPASYWVYGVNDQLTIGASFNAPAGLTTDARDTWAGVPNGDKSKVATYNFNPNVSYKLNDMLSVGLGAQIEYMTVDLTARLPGLGTQVLDASADDLGVGFTAGVLFQPTDTTNIGLGFRSSIKHKLKGDAWLGPSNLDATADYDSPEMVTLGIRQKVSDDLTLLGGVEWSNWSRFDALVLKTTGGPTLTTVENWKDSWYFSAGAEYAYSDALMLRAGAAYEKSPVPDATRTPRLPDNDRIWLSIGASYKLADNMTANIGYSHVFMDDGTVNLAAPPSPAPLTATFKQHLDLVSASLTMDW